MMGKTNERLLFSCILLSIVAGVAGTTGALVRGISAPVPAQATGHSWDFVTNGTRLTYVYTLGGEDREITYELRNLSTQTGDAYSYDDDSKYENITYIVVSRENNSAYNGSASTSGATVTVGSERDGTALTVPVYERTIQGRVYTYAAPYGIAVKVDYGWAVLKLKYFPWLVPTSSEDVPGYQVLPLVASLAVGAALAARVAFRRRS
ncbi:MAG: hypothetical protein ACTSU5_05180 [Promethearchaeota archaeon]